LSRDMAASANAPPLGGGFGSAFPKFQLWACPRSLIPNFTAGLGGLGAEDRLVKSESVGQGGKGNTLEIIRVQSPEKGDGTPANMSVGVELGEVGPVYDPFAAAGAGGGLVSEGLHYN
jgi:hypothetical protein